MNAYGCIVTVAVRSSIVLTEDVNFHWRGSEAACRRKAMLKKGAVRIVKVEPLDEARYVRAFGLAQRM